MKSRATWGFLPTELNTVLMQKLGYVDLRTGRMRKDAPNFSEFMNHILTDALMEGRHSRANEISPESLLATWCEYQLKQMDKEYGEFQRRYKELQKRRDDAIDQERERALKIAKIGGA